MKKLTILLASTLSLPVIAQEEPCLSQFQLNQLDGNLSCTVIEEGLYAHKLVVLQCSDGEEHKAHIMNLSISATGITAITSMRSGVILFDIDPANMTYCVDAEL